jgi:imidazolonepropionase-like amidohydrolase
MNVRRHGRVRLLSLVGLLGSVCMSLPVGAQSAGDGAVVALRCGRVIDVVSGRATEDVVIVVRGERIESISNRAAPSDARTIDLSSMTCLPGLIDVHTHIAFNRASS